MDEVKKKNPIPSLAGYGGVRSLQKKLERSTTLQQNREASIKSNTKVDKEGNSYTTLDIELWDKVGVLRLLAKASGLLDNPEESDKPSVLGINIRAPEIIDNGETTGPDNKDTE